MIPTSLFGALLDITYAASGAVDPIECYYASMFASFYDQSDSQPSCAAVKAIARGKGHVPRKLLHHYRDPDCPRCPAKLQEDLHALAYCCFPDAVRRNALRSGLTRYLQSLPAADAEDILAHAADADLIQLWTRLTWYAICGDCCG